MISMYPREQADLARLSAEMLATYQRELALKLTAPERLKAAYGSQFFDSGRRQQLEAVCAAAAQLLEADRCMVVMIGDDVRVVASSLPGETLVNPYAESYCQHLIGREGYVAIQDSTNHALVCHTRASVVGGIRSYLGVPLITDAGQIIGSLCCWNFRERIWTAVEVAMLTSFAAVLMRFDDAGPAGNDEQTGVL